MSSKDHEETSDVESANRNDSPFEKWKRNEHGLVKSVDHVFNEDGSVNWRAMIKPEFLYPNPEWFERRGKDVPNSIEGLRDNQLPIMLGGLKELAKLRGFYSVSSKIEKNDNNYVVASCEIQWISNYENVAGMSFRDYANATASNTDDFCVKFLETIAVNRAFVRCVRNSLGIHIVGADEMDKSSDKGPASSIDDVPENNSSTALSALKKAASSKGLSSFDDFLTKMRELYEQAKKDGNSSEQETLTELKGMSSFEDIPAKTGRKLLAIVNSL